jgi:transcriptional regulator with XRE-family HTH domain
MLKEIRTHYGIPQELFAGYLGISRSQLSMAESGKRQLSTAIILQLLPLFQAISKPKAKPKDEKLIRDKTLQKEEVNKFCRFRMDENEYKIKLLQKRLAKMIADQERAAHILQTIPSIRVEAKAKDMSLLEIVESSARNLQKKTQESSQLLLELTIQHLKAENSYLNKRSKKPVNKKSAS